MKVIIIENDNSANNAKVRESELLYHKLKKRGIDVHIIESNPVFLVKPLTKKQKKKYFITN